MNEKVVLSGMRPTGKLHLGNYFGALDNWLKLQNDYKCFFFVADWHALTTGYEDVSQMKQNTQDVVVDWLSCGLDPEKCVIFLQSAIKEHAELHLLFSMATPLSWLTRCPTYKDQLSQLKERNLTTYGFLGYPCLQAADILIYNADYVPVGEDQLPHLELTREIARRFNHLYGEVFSEPQPLLTQAKLLPGTDGRKMSKSYGNTIAISESPDEINKKVRMMVTDPARIKKDDQGHPEICTVYYYHKLMDEKRGSEIETMCRQGCIGCVACKKELAEKMINFNSGIYEKKLELEKNPDHIRDVIRAGCEKASEYAEVTMKKVREAMNLSWL